MNSTSILPILMAVVGSSLFTGCQSSTVYFNPVPRRGLEYVSAKGGNPKVLVPGIAPLKDIVCPAGEEVLYLVGEKGIGRWRYDGSHHSNVVETTLATGAALDQKAGRIYWTDWGENPNSAEARIASATTNGDDRRILITGLRCPLEVAVNPNKGRLYWIKEPPNGGVWAGNLDGSGAKRIMEGLFLLSPVAVDTRTGRIFWAQGYFGEQPAFIWTARHDGSEVKTILLQPNVFIDGLTVDENDRRIIWIERGPNDGPARIASAKFDGSAIRTVHQFTGGAFAIAVGVGPPRKK